MAMDTTKMAEVYGGNSRELLAVPKPTAEVDNTASQAPPQTAPETSGPAVVTDISREALAASRAAAPPPEQTAAVKARAQVQPPEQTQAQPPAQQQQPPAYKAAQQSKVDMIV